MKKTRKLPGMTVIELVMAVAILTVIIAVCTAILYTYLETHKKQEAMVKEELQVRHAMLTIARELHELKAKLLEDPPGSGFFTKKFTDEGVAVGFEVGSPQIVTGANSLTLRDADGVLVHEYVLMADSDAVDGSYKLVDNAAAPPTLIATGLAPGGFAVDCTDTIPISVTGAGGGSVVYTYIENVTISVKGVTGAVDIEDMVVRVYRGSV